MASEVTYVEMSEFEKLKKDFKKLQKQVKKMQKQLNMSDDPEKPKRENGFSKPTVITSELAQFLGLKEGELIARTEVTKRINGYVKENNLQDSNNKRIILLDDKLKALINPPDDVELTFFNLQKYIKHHYPTVKSATKEDTPPKSTELKIELNSSPEVTPKAGDEDKKKVVKKKVVKKN